MDLFKFTFLITFLIVINSTFGMNLSSVTDVKLVDQLSMEANASERIILRQDPNKLLNLTKSYTINKLGHTWFHRSIPISLVFETKNSFYLVTSVDHPSNLTITFNYKVNPKKIIQSKYHYLIKKSEHQLNTKQIEMVFQDLNLDNFLSKESDLLDFFNRQLANNVVVSNVGGLGKNFKVILKSSHDFSFKTKDLANSICPSNNNENSLTKAIGLKLLDCSMKFSDVQNNNSTDYLVNDLDLDFDILMNGYLPISSNYILLIIVSLIQIWFLF